MKWVPCLAALLAIGSGCLSLNRGSDQVALTSPGKGSAGKPAPAPPATVVSTEMAAAPITGEHFREAPRREGELVAEVNVTSPSPPSELPGERTATRAARTSTPEMPRSRPPVFAAEPAPVTPETKGVEPTPRANAVAVAAAASAGETRLPTIISGSLDASAVELAAAKPPSAVELATAKPPSAADLPVPKPLSAAVRMVSSKRISLNYEIKDVGPSGVSIVEFWYTQDGTKWEKYDTASQARPPFVIDVKDEGFYGFTLVARNGVGLGKRAPHAGEQPQIWVEVDTTKPVVKLLDTQVAIGRDGQQLTICWKASDSNLAPRPITLSSAEQPTGPWMVIANNLENTGMYVWQLPAGVPPRLLIRVEATDLVGNVGIAQVAEPIFLDLSQPSVAIVAVESVSK